MTGERPARGDVKEERVITVWPCEHGGTLVEPGRCPRNYTCSACGAKPGFFTPESRALRAEAAADELREALERIASLKLRPILDPHDCEPFRQIARVALSHHPPEEES